MAGSSALILAISAASVGFLHSLSPHHWMPVLLVSRAEKWGPRGVFAGSVVASAGHVAISLALGVALFWMEKDFLLEREAEIESYAGLMLAGFGLLYGIIGWRAHGRCRGEHAHHHGPSYSPNRRRPFLFLFLMGLAPCVAVLPIYSVAAFQGAAALVLISVAFSAGVIAALAGASLLAHRGVMKLDHPVIEHYGSAIAGGAIFVAGVLVFIFHH